MKGKILIATPVYERADVGQVAAHHAAALWALARNPELANRVEGTSDARAITPEDNPLGLGWAGTDIVRSRSRMLEDFRLEPEFTHILWWDTDVVAEPNQIALCIGGMLRAGKGIVGVPYPKKFVHLDRVAKTGLVEAAHTYNYQNSTPQRVDDVGCIKVDRVAGGFTLVERHVVETMRSHYAGDPELVYDDEFDGVKPKRETIALYQLIVKDRALLSEDYSFCERWTRIGGDVHLYLGPGAPLDHVGGHRFRGDIRGIMSPRG
jgi:hypothetical protein